MPLRRRSLNRYHLVIEGLEGRSVPASFEGLGIYWDNSDPLTPLDHAAYAVAADGKAVISGNGHYAAGRVEAYWWTEEGGRTGLGYLPGGIPNSSARGMSPDGTVVVGSTGSAAGNQAFKWTAAGGMVGLGYLPTQFGEYFESVAIATSSDGSVVVGSTTSANSGAPQAFRWTAAGGMVGLGYMPGGGTGSVATGVSADGSVVLGHNGFSAGAQAYRWTAADGWAGLGDLPGGGTGTVATGMSADGSVVVGYGTSAAGTEAFRWTAARGMVGLGDLPSTSFGSRATAVSADGSVVVGASNGASGAFVWDATRGMRSLRNLLVTEYGLGEELTGWYLSDALGISADGTVILGYGYDGLRGKYRAWKADLSDPVKLVDFREASPGESGSPAADTLLLEYEVKKEVSSVRLRFAASADPKFDARDRILGELKLTPAAIAASNGAMRLLGEAGTDALKIGTHKLLIRPSATDLPKLATALTDDKVGHVLAAAEGGKTTDTQVAFAGIYQSPLTSKAVVRGTPMGDEVEVSTAGDVSFTPGDGPGSGVKRTVGVGPDRGVLVFGYDGDDSLTGGGGNDTLDGGAGGDTYTFPAGRAGVKTIKEAATKVGSPDIDTLDFKEFDAGLKLNLASTREQAQGTGLKVKLSDPKGIEVVFGTDQDDVMQGNAGDNALIGRGGNDKLTGVGTGTNILLGDDTAFEAAKWSDVVKGVFGSKIPVFDWGMVGAGNDTLAGGTGLDVIIGGDGNDTIDDLAGAGILFGDGFTVSVSVGDIDISGLLNKKSGTKLIWQALKDMFGLPDFALIGTGNDSIRAGGGLINVVVAGAGDDTVVTDSVVADFVFGGDGKDTITATPTGLGVVVGGAGDDTIVGGDRYTFASLLIGDGFDVGGVKPDFGFDHDVATGTYSVTLSAGIVSEGNGNDTLTSQSRFGVTIDGDGNDTITTKGTVQYALGDTVNLGAEVKLDLAQAFKALLGRGGSLVPEVALPGLAGAGTDGISAGATVNMAFGGDGVDTISAGPASRFNVLFGNDGADTVTGGAGAADVILGGEGDDNVAGGNGFNLVFGDGFDLALGAFPVDFGALKKGRWVTGAGLVASGNGRDVVTGGTGTDILVGGDGDDTLTDLGGLNLLLGDAINLAFGESIELTQLFKAVKGNGMYVFPFQMTGSGADVITAGGGTDIAIGGAGADSISTGAGLDALFGNTGNDTLRGGAGVDILFGGDDNDDLNGEAGFPDIHRGGAGQDLFPRPLNALDLETTVWDYTEAEDLLTP